MQDWFRRQNRKVRQAHKELRTLQRAVNGRLARTRAGMSTGCALCGGRIYMHGMCHDHAMNLLDIRRACA